MLSIASLRLRRADLSNHDVPIWVITMAEARIDREGGAWAGVEQGVAKEASRKGAAAAGA